MLKINGQIVSENKEEMIARIADGIILGQLPKCPKCCKSEFNFISFKTLKKKLL